MVWNLTRFGVVTVASGLVPSFWWGTLRTRPDVLADDWRTLRTDVLKPWLKSASDIFTTGSTLSVFDSWTFLDLALAGGCPSV